MKYLLDTNTCICLLNGRHPGVVKRLSVVSAQDVAVSSVVWFELMVGAAKSVKRQEVERRLRIFERQIEVLPLDAEAAEAAAEVRAELERVGRPIGAYDLLIAGQAVARGATLVTSNTREFKRVPKLRLVDWGVR